MPEITLPDGSTRQFESAVTVQQVAADIGAGLAKAALAGRVDGELVDTAFRIEHDATVAIVTARDDDGIEVIRHSCAHLLAQAVKQLFPAAQVTIGPVIEDGFYYDFSYEPGFTESDLEKIETRMTELAKQDIEVERSVMERAEAIAFFRQQGEVYKAEIIEAIPSEEPLSLYRQGDFIDLCRGPHVPSTGHLKAFQLTKLAGAYWRGDSRNEMLTRIYGTAWQDKKALKAYLTRLQEAEKRDHRKLGKRFDFFHFEPESPGMVFWHERGWTLYQVIENYMRQKYLEYDYQLVQTPQILDRSLWERSGHWDKFQQNMYTTSIDDRDYAIKPMNCPGHIQIFNQGLRSHRELPIRIGEFGMVHRNEPSGSLHGLLRVRRFTQDDGHVFCTEDQIQQECATLIDFVYQVNGDFGFTDISVALSTRPDERVGEDEQWDKAELALADALQARGLDYTIQPGEGAFYGPKIEFVLNDSIGRQWQCGTIQVDFSMPGRLQAEYIDESSSRRTPVMIHRAILGSLERFIGILIEETEGRFPLWLAPVQVALMSITDRQHSYVLEIEKLLKQKQFRPLSDLRNEKIGFKIREHTLSKIPYLVVIGDREVEQRQVTLRNLEGEDLGSMELDALIERFESERDARG